MLMAHIYYFLIYHLNTIFEVRNAIYDYVNFQVLNISMLNIGVNLKLLFVILQDVWHCEICNRKPGRGFGMFCLVGW